MRNAEPNVSDIEQARLANLSDSELFDDLSTLMANTTKMKSLKILLDDSKKDPKISA
jgi:hypothetical protein